MLSLDKACQRVYRHQTHRIRRLAADPVALAGDSLGLGFVLALVAGLVLAPAAIAEAGRAFAFG